VNHHVIDEVLEKVWEIAGPLVVGNLSYGNKPKRPECAIDLLSTPLASTGKEVSGGFT